MWYAGQSALLCRDGQPFDVVTVQRVTGNFFYIRNRHDVISRIRFKVKDGRPYGRFNKQPIHVRPASLLQIDNFLKTVERTDLLYMMSLIRRDEIISITEEEFGKLKTVLKEIGLYNEKREGLTY